MDLRFQPEPAGNVACRQVDVTEEAIGHDEFDLVHARGVLQHLHQREEVLAAMVDAARPGGYVVVTDTDWIQFDAQAIPEAGLRHGVGVQQDQELAAVRRLR